MRPRTAWLLIRRFSHDTIFASSILKYISLAVEDTNRLGIAFSAERPPRLSGHECRCQPGVSHRTVERSPLSSSHQVEFPLRSEISLPTDLLWENRASAERRRRSAAMPARLLPARSRSQAASSCGASSTQRIDESATRGHISAVLLRNGRISPQGRTAQWNPAGRARSRYGCWTPTMTTEACSRRRYSSLCRAPMRGGGVWQRVFVPRLTRRISRHSGARCRCRLHPELEGRLRLRLWMTEGSRV